ncbi:MAG TPA: DUF5652 family protein [Patescibacteria group bacterium]|nr:DUF5652 family protein [Patescibacteria group bacterium]
MLLKSLLNPFSILFPFFILFFALDLVFKAMALWKAARNSQKIWFVVLLIVNSIGILPVIYLLFFQKKNSK